LYKNAKELDIIFHGGIFHMKYGPNDNEVLSAQKELIRALQLNPQEVLIQDYLHASLCSIAMNVVGG
jgi:hypothetical protein